MTSETQLESKRAIEALRAGVPNRDAVRALGCSQPAIEEQVNKQLESVRGTLAQGTTAVGTLFASNFGTGKSHLLEYLQHIALQNNFVCSKIVISKETPLYDAGKVFTAAMESAKLPDRTGAVLTEVAQKLRDSKFNSREYTEFVKWVNRPDNGLSRHFAAAVFILNGAGVDLLPETADRIIQFWSGNPIGVVELRKLLRDVGEAATYKIDRVSAKELATQRYNFIPRLMAAAGYAGWVILIDEVELIGRYSLRQRAKSYMEVARLMGKLEGESTPGLTAVLSISLEFVSDVLEDRNDEEKILNRLRAGGSDGELLLASQAEQGMRIIRRDMMELGPTDTLIREIYNKVRNVYATAYGWDPPEDYNDHDKTARLRQHIKKWINAWDLMRLYPGHKPEIQVTELKQDFSEMPEIEQLSVEDTDKDETS